MIPSSDAGDAFVGRERELHDLLARLAQARAGRGGLVLLVGEPGIGKTRTAEEFAAHSDLAPGSILWGRCSEHEGSPAFWPWVQALRGHAAQVDPEQLRADLGAAALDVARVVPEIRVHLPDLPDAEPAEPAQARFRVFDGVAQWLRAAAARSPLLVILDDLHWADQDSVLLLEHVAYEARASPLLLLGTYREAEMLRTPGRLGTLARVAQRVLLRGLDRSGVDAFVRASAVTPSAAVLNDLAATSEGNPFFLGELVRVLQSEGGGTRAPLAARELPHEVRDAVRRHLEPLSDEDRRLLGIAAVLGREFDFDIWRLACDQPAEPLLERLAACADAGLVRAAPQHPGRHAFCHALIRETLYADLPVSARAGLHRRLARILEDTSAGAADPPVAAIAHHYFQAAPLGEGGKAIEYARRAGRHAADVLAHHEAVEHYARALAALSFVPPDSELELELLLDLGEAHWRAGDFVEARTTYERAGRQARARDDAPGMTRAVLMLAAASPEVGAPNATLIGLCEDALRRLGPGDNPLRAAVLARLATALYFAPDTARRDALSTEALDLARRTGGSLTLGTALLARHLALWRPDGSLAERLAIARELVGLPDLDLHQSLEGHAWLIIDLLELGEHTTADREIDVYVARCEESRLPHRRWHATLIRATRALLAGRLAESAALAAEALAIRQEGFGSLAAQFYAAQLFVPFREMGRLQELEPAYATLARTYAALPIWRVGLALIHADGGDETAARRALDALAAREFTDLPRDGNFLPTIVQLAELISLLGDTARARLLAPLLEPFHRRHVIVGLGAGSLGSAARALGVLAATSGDPDAAVTRLDEAIAANTAFSARTWVVRTQLDLARVLVARAAPGDLERAEALRAEARQSAAGLAMPRLVQALDEASHAAPSAPRPAGPRVATEAGPLAFRQEGEFWTIGRGAGTFRLRDSKGLGYLATLLRHPGREFHVLDLTSGGTADTAVPHAAVAGGVELPPTDGGDAGEMLDPQARAAYRRRLEDVQSEIEEAESFNDDHRAAQLRAERDMLAAELARGVGLGGRSRKAASHAERARLNVTRAIGSVVRKIAAQDQVLGRHLETSVHTGVFCSYTPYETIAWEL